MQRERIALKHGAGGRAMRALIERGLRDGFRQPPVDGVGLAAMDDGAALRDRRPLARHHHRLARDPSALLPRRRHRPARRRRHGQRPGDDGRHRGARRSPAPSSSRRASRVADLERIQRSMRATCSEAGAPVVTGDTKVMGRGELDGLVINTTGVGPHRPRRPRLRPPPRRSAARHRHDRRSRPGHHGATRHGLELDGELRSDVAPLNDLVGTRARGRRRRRRRR